jgi:heme-degrading monooxygenase HmoA
MVEIVREFVVKEEARGQFELVFGPGGAWSKLFGRSPGFRGTTLLRGTQSPPRYLTIDFWETEAHWEQALAERQAEYTDLDATLAEWTESRAEVGVFTALAQATVQPRGRTGDTRRRNRRTTR